MQKIGAILTRNFHNPTLQRAFFEHQAGAAWDTLLQTQALEPYRRELDHLIRRQSKSVTVHLTSKNALLLTHLRLQATTLEAEYLRLLQAIDTRIETVTLKLRSR